MAYFREESEVTRYYEKHRYLFYIKISDIFIICLRGMVSINSYSETESGTDSRSGNEEDGKTSDHSKGRNTGSLTSRKSDDNGEVFEEKTNC